MNYDRKLKNFTNRFSYASHSLTVQADVVFITHSSRATAMGVLHIIAIYLNLFIYFYLQIIQPL